MSADPLLIFPCNGNAIEAMDCLGHAHELLAFIDDDEEKIGASKLGVPILGREALQRYPRARLLAVPGSPRTFTSRDEAIVGLGIDPERFTRVIHPGAAVSPRASLGQNVLVMAGVVITSNARIGDHVCILPNSVVHHDARVGSLTLVGSNVTIAGSATIGDKSYVGSGSSIRDGVQIGAGVLVGLGANVVRDVRPGARVAGNPAREL